MRRHRMINTSKRRRQTRLAASWAIAHPWGTGGAYPNFPGPDLADVPAAYHGANYDRLTSVKAAYHPDDVFGFPQSLPALSVG